MQQTWRWFGPYDTVSIDDMRQAGVEGVVSALHHIPNGALWTLEEIRKRQQEIATGGDGEPSGLAWDVVESLPVSEEIKQQTGNWRQHLTTYQDSLRNLAEADIKTVCYNFMPVLDWTRTDLSYPVATGARCMRFDIADFAAFDIFLLQRLGANTSFPDDVVEEATRRMAHYTDEQKSRLMSNITCGLPGAEESYTLDDLREHLAAYATISDARLREHQIAFLETVVPVAEELGMRLCCHPDDPPFSLLGLPRIMSTEADYKKMTEAVDSPANGITLCSGSLGVRADNNLPGMMNRLGSKVHFVHLRNIYRETPGALPSFYEAAHLEGVTDMVALIKAILDEESRRREENRADWSIPFRPDHGQQILTDLKAHSQPGYPAVGRLKGLAELRGIMMALSHPQIGVVA